VVLKCAVADIFFKNMSSPSRCSLYTEYVQHNGVGTETGSFCVTALTNESLETGMWNFIHRCDHTRKICRFMLRGNCKSGGKLTYTHARTHDTFNTAFAVAYTRGGQIFQKPTRPSKV